MAVQIQQRGDTAAAWTAANPVLAAREVGWETDSRRSKIGDGVTAWNSLAYTNATGGSADPVAAVSIVSGAATVDCGAGLAKNFTLSMTTNATLAVSNLAGAGKISEFELQITQDATGSRTLTLPAAFRALGGSDTAISAVANSVTILSAKTFDNGTTWRYAMQESA